MASDLMNGTSMPLETDDSFDTLRDRLREAYSHGVDGLIDRCLESLILPDQRAAVLLDLAQFTVFLAAVKTAGLSSQAHDRKALMQAYRKLHLAIDQEVPKQLMVFVDAMQAAAAEGGQG